MLFKGGTYMYIVQSFIYSSMSIYPCVMGNKLNTWPEVRTQKTIQDHKYQTRIQIAYFNILTQVSCNVLWSYMKYSKNAKWCPPIPSLIQFVHGHYRLTECAVLKLSKCFWWTVFLMNCFWLLLFALHIYVFTCQIHIGIKLAAPLNAVHTFLD